MTKKLGQLSVIGMLAHSAATKATSVFSILARLQTTIQINSAIGAHGLINGKALELRFGWRLIE